MQGITLVTFPAASTIFTSGSGYGLSAGEYGAMFVPQVIAALVASLAGATIAARAGWKLVYLAGLTLPEIYAGSAVVAGGLGVLSLAIAHGRRSPAAVHPRPFTHPRSLARERNFRAHERCAL